MFQVREYQIKAIDAIKETFKKNNRQYIQMPTGSGKTFTFLKYASDNHERILVIVPSKELLKQVYSSALNFYHKNQISRKGGGFTEHPKEIHICIINSLRSDYLTYITDQYFDLVVIDEAHHSYAASYQNVIDNMAFAPFILGVTATPDRRDGKLLHDVLLHCSFKLEIEEMISKGFLSDIEGFSVKTKIDLSDVDSQNGDFSLVQLYKQLSIESRNQMIVDLVKQHMNDRKTLVFCINVSHSKEVNNLLNLNGIPSCHIDGSMKDEKRNSILSAFRNGEISTLCNCQLLTEGFDEPSINGIVLARPTTSKALFTQMIGRGLRINPGKTNCKIIDIVDSHKNLAGFNDLIDDTGLKELESFKSIKDIRNNVEKQKFQVIETSIERTNFFNQSQIHDLEATHSMKEYLDKNDVYFEEPMTFDEGSFLVWFNELKKEYKDGYNRKKNT